MSRPAATPAPMRARLLSLLLRPTAPSLALGLVVAASLIAAESVLVYVLKQVAPGNAFGVVFLLGVVLVSTVWGFGVALATSVASAIAFDYFRSWPGNFIPTQAQNVAVIAVFLVVALVANTLAFMARTRAVETDQPRREADLAADGARGLAELQASLRRVATLVAHGVSPPEVFSAVATELATVLRVRNAAVFRYEPDGTAVLLAAHDELDLTKTSAGERISLEGENVAAMVLRTGRAARVNSYENASGSAATRMRALGVRSGIGAPIILNGRVWGVAIVGSKRPEPLPPDTEARVGDFADLVATAIANAATRAELTASRARIVAAGDDARRRFERDLHDGAQQRLVALGLQVRTAEALVPPEQSALREQISDIATGLAGVSADLQEISRGIHPAILSKGGLGPALQALARRSAVPVELDLGVDQRLPQSGEVAAYYIVAEALTNAAKHAQASTVKVRVDTEGAYLGVSIRDDGIGGADSAKGSGLSGLIDRVEALGGRMTISSHARSGTSLLVKIPLEVH
jgi:signal transduction histidine kinase